MASIIGVETLQHTNGTTAAEISSGGILTAPKVPAFSARISSTHSTSGTTVVFDTEDSDNGSDYDTSTGIFTAPVAGMYSFTTRGARIYNDPSGDYYLAIQKNGTNQIQFLNTHVTNYFSWTGGSYVLDLAVGDEVKVQWWCAGSGNKRLYASGVNSAFFTGHLLG